MTVIGTEMESQYRILFAICAALSLGLAGIFAYLQLGGARQHEGLKPAITYSKLIYIANTCSLFKEKHGEWPTNLDQLCTYRPDLFQAVSDSSDRVFSFVRYDTNLGYGMLISHGEDGRIGGAGVPDQGFVVRFPVETKTNKEWNDSVGEKYRNPHMGF
jgi:hypothetical protein